jgi:hydroxyethylthiazole kinase-like uncharacterized protein yjeF
MPDSLSPALLTNSEMAEADRLTIAGGTPGSALMEQAGAVVAREAKRLLPRHGRVAVCCGPGNNGGDGFVAARVLAAQEFTVELGLLGARDRLPRLPPRVGPARSSASRNLISILPIS